MKRPWLESYGSQLWKWKASPPLSAVLFSSWPQNTKLWEDYGLQVWYGSPRKFTQQEQGVISKPVLMPAYHKLTFCQGLSHPISMQKLPFGIRQRCTGKWCNCNINSCVTHFSWQGSTKWYIGVKQSVPVITLTQGTAMQVMYKTTNCQAFCEPIYIHFMLKLKQMSNIPVFGT